MSQIQRNLAIGLLLAAVAGGGLYFFFIRGTQASLFGTGTSTTTAPAVTGEVTGTGDYTVEYLGEPPSLDKPIVISASLSEEAKTILRNKIEVQLEILREDPKRIDVWLQLGVNRKISGDFEGAIEAWDYISVVADDATRATAFGNLGDLYMYFLKDYVNAEGNFKQAIALNPKVVDYYRALFYLYRDIYKDNAKAEAIRAEGIKNNPDNKTELQNLK